jgi:hypothetical protein
MIIFPLITTWMWFEVAMAVQSLSNNTLCRLVAGPTVFICDECVELCMDIIRKENRSSTTTGSTELNGRCLTTPDPSDNRSEQWVRLFDLSQSPNGSELALSEKPE